VFYARYNYRTYYNGYSTISLSSSVANPTPGQLYYVYGYVKNPYGTALNAAPVRIYYRYWTGSAYTGWYYYTTAVRTSSSGFYYMYQQRSTYTQYQALFLGYNTGYGIYTYWYQWSNVLTVDAR
jgi:hypothetical protein